LGIRGVAFDSQAPWPVVCKGQKLDCGYRMDVVVEDRVALELKAVEGLPALHEVQLLTYLRLSKKRVGLLISFNAIVLKDGIVRRVL
jgi:GxxExxY protein